MRTTVLAMAVPAVAGWSDTIRASSGGIRGSCLQMEDVAISSTCDSSRHEKLTRFAFTMAQGSSGTAGPCNTPGEPVSLEFNAPVTSAFHLLREGGEVDDNKVTFLAEDHLELSVILDTTGLADGQAILASVGSLRGPWTVPACNDANRSAAAILFERKLRGTTPPLTEAVDASETPATSDEDDGGVADDVTPAPTAAPEDVEEDEDTTAAPAADESMGPVADESTPSPTKMNAASPSEVEVNLDEDGTDDDEDDCSVCSNLSSADAEALITDTHGVKRIVCDATCLLDGADNTHCNYFGLGQICRGCGECDNDYCQPCPDESTPSPTFGMDLDDRETPSPVTPASSSAAAKDTPAPVTPAPTIAATLTPDVATPSPTEPQGDLPETPSPETPAPSSAPVKNTPSPETPSPTTATTLTPDLATPSPMTTPEPSPAPVTETPETTPPTTAPVDVATPSPTRTPEPSPAPATETPETTPPTMAPVDVATPSPTTTPEPSPAPATETPETTPPTTAPVDVATPSPTTTPEPSPGPATETPETTPPTTVPVGSTPAPFVPELELDKDQYALAPSVPGLGLDEDQHDCSVCSEVSSEDAEALVNDDKGVKQIVCDPACVGEATDVLHCNYFGLGQICRGCGECDDGWCQPCPDATPSPVVPTPSPAPLGFDDLSTPSPFTPETPAPVKSTPSPETPETAPPTVAETPAPKATTPSPTVVPETTSDPSTPSPVTPETPAPSVKAVKRTPSPETPETAPPTIAETPAPKATTLSPTMESDLGFDITTPSPVTPETPAPSAKPVKYTPSPETPETAPPTVAETTESEVPSPSPTMMPLGADGAVDDADDECSVCSNLTDEQVADLASYDNGGKQVVCDPTCLDGVTDPLHCNYFGLGQICRGCGDCSSCEPCPGTTPAPETTSSPTMMPDLGFDLFTPSPVTPETPAPSAKPVMHTPSPETPETAPPTTAPPTVAETPEPEVPTPSPTMMPLGADGAVDDDDDECSVCSNLTDEQVAVLASYDNGGKQVVCDPTCLDGVADPLHCNYFGLGQICRGCGECSLCEPCPGTTPAPETTSSPTMMPDLGFDITTPSPVKPETPAPSAKPVMHTPSPETPETTPPTVVETPESEVPTPSPTMMPLGADGAVDDADDECSVCSNLTDEQVEVLASYDNGGKQVVCDPTCLDGVADPLHCNYFGLGQICRGCGECSLCEPCPGTTPAPETTSSPTMMPDLGFDITTPSPVKPETPAPSAKPVKHTPSPETPETTPPTAGETPEPEVPTPSPTMIPLGADGAVDDDDDECSVCSNLTEAQMESLAAYPDGGKQIICDPRCVDGSSDITHCNYFGLGQICRGCGDCDDCTPCP
ncbi:unnamed protein product [Ectocarpus sp. 12 AP-2014]